MLTDAHKDKKLAYVVRSNIWATEAQTAEEVTVGFERKASEYILHLHHSWVGQVDPLQGLNGTTIVTKPSTMEQLQNHGAAVMCSHG